MSWQVEYDWHDDGDWKPFPGRTSHPFGWAWRIGVRFQLKNYLGKVRLRHNALGTIIPLHELLRAEIKAFCVKKVHAV